MYTEEQKKLFRGVGALVLTPFNEDLSINHDGIAVNARYIIDNGITTGNGFLIANGTMSECYALTMEERKQVIKKVVETAAGDAPVMAGCNDTAAHNVIELAKYAKEVGAQAVLITQPFYIPHSDEQMYVYFKYIHDNVDIPIMLYNNPLVGGRDMSTNLLRKLAKLDKVFGLKQATEKTMNFVHSDVLTDELLVFSASSSQQPFGKLANMSGFVSFISSINPKLQLSLWQAIEKGNLQEALGLHAQELLLYDWWWSGGVAQPAGGIVHMKKGMDLLGLSGGYVRPPLVQEMTEQEVIKLTGIMKVWGLL
jgi:4-hydroxy-tetrahydrodipicolinate synthase